MEEITKRSSLPVVADIHFNHKLALIASEVVDCIRINPGNIGDKSRIKEIVKACQERSIPIRIGVNSGSLEKKKKLTPPKRRERKKTKRREGTRTLPYNLSNLFSATALDRVS